MGREKPGDGSELKPIRRLDPLWRSVLGIDHAGDRWDIEVDFFDWDETVNLYRDGRQDRKQTGRARFELGDDARIDVAMSMFGLKRAHLVLSDGTQRQLVPAEGTAEAWRARVERDSPGLSRALGLLSWIVLVIALLLELPQLAQLVSELTGWYEFTSPIVLPSALNTVVVLAGVAAGIERALRLRYHWLLDS